eukprot:3660446-Rhodomonas_salina.3
MNATSALESALLQPRAVRFPASPQLMHQEGGVSGVYGAHCGVWAGGLGLRGTAAVKWCIWYTGHHSTRNQTEKGPFRVQFVKKSWCLVFDLATGG